MQDRPSHLGTRSCSTESVKLVLIVSLPALCVRFAALLFRAPLLLLCVPLSAEFRLLLLAFSGIGLTSPHSPLVDGDPVEKPLATHECTNGMLRDVLCCARTSATCTVAARSAPTELPHAINHVHLTPAKPKLTFV